MICEYEDLAQRAAVGALDAQEAERLAAHLPVCAHCRATLRESLLLADALVFSEAAPMPRPAVRRRVLRRARRLRGWTWPISQVAVFGLLVLGTGTWMGAALAGRAPATATTHNGYVVGSLWPTHKVRTAKGEVMLLPEAGRMTVMAAGLTVLPLGRVYEAWMMTSHGPVAVGPLHVDREGYAWMAARIPGTGYRGLVVSIEQPAPGALPKGPIVLRSQGAAR